jgi:hypothetical protein
MFCFWNFFWFFVFAFWPRLVKTMCNKATCVIRQVYSIRFPCAHLTTVFWRIFDEQDAGNE